MKWILHVLTPAVSPRERLYFCFFLALILHGMAIFGVGFTPVVPASATTIELVWDDGGLSGDIWGTGDDASGLPAWASAVASAGTSLQQEAEQNYVRQWVAHTERLGASIAEGLKGEVEAHVEVAADGRIRSIEVAPGSDTNLQRAVHDIVRRAQPHPEFPAELREHQDSVRISRLWQFGNNKEQKEDATP